MPDNVVSLLIGNKKLTGWKSVSISKGLDTIADMFTFNMVDVWDGDDSPLVPYEECKINIEKTAGGRTSKDLVVTGYIDDFGIDIDAAMMKISMNGRSKTGDLVDCSAELLPANSWNNALLTTIIRDLIFEYNVDLDFVSTSAKSNDVKLSLSINSGETIFEIVNRECRKRSILPVVNPYGNLELITTGDRYARDKIILGENINKASVSFDYSNRFGTYKVKAQKSGSGDSWKNSTNNISAESSDGVFQNRFRNKVIVLDGAGSNDDAQKTANWEAQVRAGKTGKLTVTIPSWYQSDGTLWEVGMLTYCKIPPLRIDEELLLNSIEFTQDDGGTMSSLEFVNKDTYLAAPPKETKVTKKSKKKGFGYGW